jgi:hypothetical protein
MRAVSSKGVGLPVVAQFGFRSVLIPKGFKLIAMGERCATPTDSIEKRS